MYSMKRSVTPVSRAQRAIGTIEASLTPAHDHVHLDRRETRLERGVDPVEHASDGEIDPVHRAEHRVVERVEADGHSSKPGIGQREGERTQCGPVRGQREVELATIGCTHRRQHPDELGQPATDERLAPVMRSFSTPSWTKALAARWISSNDRTWSFGRKA